MTVVPWKFGILPSLEFAVIALLRFLVVARNWTVGAACVDSEMRCSFRGFLALLHSSVHCELHDIGFLETIRSSGFDSVAFLIA